MSKLRRTKVVVATLCSCSLLMGGALLLLFILASRGDDRPASEGLPEQANGILDGQSEYHSSVKGYAIQVPTDWTDVPNSIDLGSSSIDVFYSLRATGKAGVSPTFSISSESVPPKATSRDYLGFKLDFLNSVKAEVAEPRAVEVGGVKGYLIDYGGYSRNYAVDTTSVVVVTEQQGWEFVLTVPSGERSQYRPLLAEILASIRFPSR